METRFVWVYNYRTGEKMGEAKVTERFWERYIDEEDKNNFTGAIHAELLGAENMESIGAKPEDIVCLDDVIYTYNSDYKNY